MRSLSGYNPISVFVYYLFTVGIAMFCMNPVITALSLCGAVAFFVLRGSGGIKTHLLFITLFVVMALINPLVYHDGATVLLVVNDNRITLEALLYGVSASGMIVAALYWFRTFSAIMTSDRLLYLFGSFSPKLALVLSMALRYVPRFASRTKEVWDAQKALGLCKDDSLPDSIKGGACVFSVMTTWALENGIVTADSMSARGYGIFRKRTSFSLFRFRRADALLMSVAALLAFVAAAGMISGALRFEFYPKIVFSRPCLLSAAAYAAYGILAFLPFLMETAERIKWKYLRSKI